MKSRMLCALQRATIGGGLILMATAWPVASALAHAMLVKAEPPRRATLTAAPKKVQLWFNEAVEKDYASLTLLDANETAVTEARPHVAPDDPNAIVLPLPDDLNPGKYTVKFRVLSVDGHVVDSSYDFTVKNKAQNP